MLAAKRSLSRRLSSSGVRRMFSLKRDSGRRVDGTLRKWSRFEALSMEVISEISTHISAASDLLHLCLTSRRMFTLMLPYLYSNVELKSNKHCIVWLDSVLEHTGYIQHVRRLAVHPNNSEWTIPERSVDEDEVASMIESLAPHLVSLHTFIWDGSEIPVDSLWLSLRTSCSALKNISMSVGNKDLILDSHLYEFNDLRSFSLVVKWRSLSWLCDGKLRIERLPKNLWKMLIEHCPNLEELALSAIAPSPRLFDIKHIVHGRWPCLKHLTLGDLRLLPKTNDLKALQNFLQDFKNFVLAHPSLMSLTFQHAGGENFPESLSLLPRFALPCLKSFSGTLKYVRSLPRPTMALIRHLSLTCLYHSLASMPGLTNALAGLESLVSLRIWIDLSFDSGRPDHEKVFGNLLAACTQLLRLDLLCFTQPTFRVAEFSNALKMCPQITSFTLTKVYNSNDAKMIDSAEQIIFDHPSLEKFVLRYSQDSWLSTRGMRPKQVGTYEVVGVDGVGTSLVPAPAPATRSKVAVESVGCDTDDQHSNDHNPDVVHESPGAPSDGVKILSVYEWGVKGPGSGRRFSRVYMRRVQARVWEQGNEGHGGRFKSRPLLSRAGTSRSSSTTTSAGVSTRASMGSGRVRVGVD